MSVLKKIMPEKIPAFGAIFYNLLPARMFTPHYQMIADEVALRENSVLLDVGTGPGILPIRIAERFPASKIIGIDLSPEMIRIANRHNLKTGNLRNVEFRVMDANALEFRDNTLDMVISTGSLHHWKDPVRILDEIYRCLKPGCVAWIYDGYGNATDEDIKKCIKKLFFGFPSTGLVKRILGIHGFSQGEYGTLVKDMVARSRFKSCTFEKRAIMMRLSFRKG